VCNYLWYTACRGGNEAQKELSLSKELAKELCWDARQENAFKHAYWSALMKIDVRMSDEDVPLVTTAHEMDHTLDLTTHEQVPYGSRESRLDVHNNQVGIKANRNKPGTEIPLTK
jgi:hypothetical protein